MSETSVNRMCVCGHDEDAHETQLSLCFIFECACPEFRPVQPGGCVSGGGNLPLDAVCRFCSHEVLNHTDNVCDVPDCPCGKEHPENENCPACDDSQADGIRRVTTGQWSPAKGISKESLLQMRRRIFRQADDILVAKGNDYNAAQQEAGDTLFNLRVCVLMGVVPSPVDGILVRLSDKMMRLTSLTRPGVESKVLDEKIEDTVLDAINYLTYLLAMWKESKGERIE